MSSIQERVWEKIREYEEIKFEIFDGIAKITINRPRYYNAFTPDTTREMNEALLIFLTGRYQASPGRLFQSFSNLPGS